LVRDNASAAPGKPKKQTEVTIDEIEFVRRWALHILPKGFVRVRHYGHASPSNRKDYLKRCYQLHGIDPPQINDSSLEAAPESIVDSRLDEGLVDEEGDPIDVFAGVSLRCSECGRPMESLLKKNKVRPFESFKHKSYDTFSQ